MPLYESTIDIFAKHYNIIYDLMIMSMEFTNIMYSLYDIVSILRECLFGFNEKIMRYNPWAF